MGNSRLQLRFTPSIPFPRNPLATLDYAVPNPSSRTSLLRTSLVPVWVVLLGAFASGMIVLVFPKYGCGCGNYSQARFTAAKTDLANLESALDAFRADVGRYPATAEGTEALVAAPDGAANAWHGPYIKLVPNDPWGTPYVYQFPGAHNPSRFDLHSRGPDRREGNDDLTNWTTP